MPALREAYASRGTSRWRSSRMCCVRKVLPGGRTLPSMREACSAPYPDHWTGGSRPYVRSLCPRADLCDM